MESITINELLGDIVLDLNQVCNQCERSETDGALLLCLTQAYVNVMRALSILAVS